MAMWKLSKTEIQRLFSGGRKLRLVSDLVANETLNLSVWIPATATARRSLGRRLQEPGPGFLQKLVFMTYLNTEFFWHRLFRFLGSRFEDVLIALA